ncbi:MAG: SRPBCC domain-containing protein [Planctomycetes bacterium]|nr:SRPBCC domain-containing protein [Planctomycetota bacterium]
MSDAPFVEWSEGNRKILRKEVIVRATVTEVWHAWTTSEGIASFFIPESNVDLRIGGPFELFMGMDEADESGLRGSESCKILGYLENEVLSFEWSFPPAVMNLRKSGAKTHVVIRLIDLGDGRVKVTLSQLGWGTGEDWDAGHAYFDKAWGMVLGMLKDHFDKREANAEKPDGSGNKSSNKTWVDKHVTVTSFEGDEKRQDFELVIPAPVEAVWNILSTGKGLEKIGGKNSVVELKPGGQWAFWPTSPTRVMSYLPNEILIASGSAPPEFPDVQKGGHWGVYSFEPVEANKTKLRLSVVGWKKGEEWDKAFAYFLKNNPVFLEWIHDALAFPVEVVRTAEKLEMSCVVAADRSDVWKAFTTEEGMKSWMVAQAKLDWRVGGRWLTKYTKEGELGDEDTIENIILCYEPERMFSLQIGNPPAKFPFKEAAKHTWTVIYFDDADAGKTRVRVVGLGYRDDEESRKMLEFFDRGNKWTLQKLQERFAPQGTFASQTAKKDAATAHEIIANSADTVPADMQSYMAHVAAAGLSLERGETTEARRWLNSAPESLRNWEWRYFDANLDQSSRQWNDIGAEAMFTAYRPDGKQIAIATTDGRVLIRDVATGGLIRTLNPNDKSFWHVTYSADGKRIATSSSDGSVRIWSAETGEELRKLVHEKSQAYSASFSPNGKLIATSLLSFVKLWDAETGKELATLEGHILRPPVIRVAFSPDGTKLASAGWDNWVIIWDVEKREILHKLGPGYGGVVYTPYNAVVFSPDGQRVAACAGSGEVWTWDVATGEMSKKWHAHDKNIYAIAYSPDSTQIATGSMDLAVRVWQADSGEALRSFRGHAGMIRGLAYQPTGHVIASAATDSSVRFWNVDDVPSPLVVKHDKGVWAARFSPDGKKIATAGSDKAIRVWNAKNGEPIAAFDDLPEQAISVAFSPCGQFLAGGTNKPSIFIWDLKTQKSVHELEGHQGGVPGLAFSPDGKLLASASYDGTIRLWDPTEGTLVRSIEGSDVSCIKAEFSPDGRMLATACKDGAVRLWNVETGAAIAALTGHTARLGAVAFNRDGSRLASVGSDRTIRIWDTATRKALHVIEGHEDGSYGLSFTPDGTRLATTSYDLTVKLWDVETGRCASTIQHTKEGGYDIVFSPDGTRLAITFTDGSVEILDSVSVAARKAKPDSVATR